MHFENNEQEKINDTCANSSPRLTGASKDPETGEVNNRLTADDEDGTDEGTNDDDDDDDDVTPLSDSDSEAEDNSPPKDDRNHKSTKPRGS